MAVSTYDRLKKIVADQLAVDEQDIKPEFSYDADLNAGSPHLVELTTSPDEVFGMELPADAAAFARRVTTLLAGSLG